MLKYKNIKNLLYFYKLPRLACSISIASKSAWKFPAPNPWNKNNYNFYCYRNLNDYINTYIMIMPLNNFYEKRWSILHIFSKYL